MNWTIPLILLTGLGAADVEESAEFDYYTSYTQSYHAAKKAQRPMLIILTEDGQSRETGYSLAKVRRTNYRGDLLEDFVVNVVDAGTEHGKTVHKLFGSKPLPRVVVIDRDQKWKLFQTSEPLDGAKWNRILETFHEGDASASLDFSEPRECFT